MEKNELLSNILELGKEAMTLKIENELLKTENKILKELLAEKGPATLR